MSDEPEREYDPENPDDAYEIIEKLLDSISVPQGVSFRQAHEVQLVRMRALKTVRDSSYGTSKPKGKPAKGTGRKQADRGAA